MCRGVSPRYILYTIHDTHVSCSVYTIHNMHDTHVVVVVLVGQTVGSISSKTLAYDCLYTLELCTRYLNCGVSPRYMRYTIHMMHMYRGVSPRCRVTCLSFGSVIVYNGVHGSVVVYQEV